MPDLHLYRDLDGLYWFGNDAEGVVPLAPSVQEFLDGFRSSLRFAANLDAEQTSALALSLEFLAPVPLADLDLESV